VTKELPLITRRTVFSTLVALAAAGLAAGCAATSASSSTVVAGAAAGGGPGQSAPAGAGPAGVSSAAASRCAGGTASTPPSPPAVGPPALDAVQFADPSHGWVAGAGRILATADAGRTWTRQYSGTAVLDQVDFTDDQHGWAAVGGSLLRTTDGGVTWTDVASGPANPQSACFASTADGYVGTPGRVWRTTDGGQRWTLALTEPGPSSGPQAGPETEDTPEIECAGPSALWVLFLGHDAAMSHSPYLAYATQDGQHWHGLFEERYTEAALRPGLKLPAGPGSYPGPFSAIGSGLAAFVGYTPPMGYGAAPVMLAAANGRVLTSEGSVAAINQPFGASFLSRSQGWVVGENLQTDAFDIEATTNAGRTWTTQYSTR
jgi:hypothetical protein